MHVSRMIYWDARARDPQLYTYKRDPGDTDEWRSHHEAVLAGKPWADDCDALASTVINLLCTQEGLPLNKAWFLHVDVNHDGRLDHMIAVAEDDNGILWVVGDTFGPVYPIRDIKHALKKFARVDNILAWYTANDYRQLKMV